jgi:asparagine synthase (glutamine-hydrolysing)
VSQLFGWLPAGSGRDTSAVVSSMASALRAAPDQPSHVWTMEGFAIGLLESVRERAIDVRCAPAVSGNGRYWLWMAGEAFEDGSGRIAIGDAEASRSTGFRSALLAELLRAGPAVLREIDGEYQIALWDRLDRTLTLVNDRFAGLPLYYARSEDGFAFAGGVRGVLMAPGIGRDPDLDAIRQAVTFGGFRLGDRTNVSSVRMLGGATCLVARADHPPAVSRYWRWSDLAPVSASSHEAIEEVHARWRSAVARRVSGASAPGQTLSGGLDSRAVLAEGAPQCATWTAITYGVPDCDEVHIARRAAARAGVDWRFHALYADAAWLDRRSARIQETDGLIELVDLMHLDALPLQASRIDVHLSGYLGDAVSGPTFNRARTATDVALQLPFYGAAIGYDHDAAVSIAEGLVRGVAPAPARFAILEHKAPQSTNRWTAAWRPWLRVRKPFLAYRFFDFCQGLPASVREDGLHERWLRTRYPSLFARIPNQKTGVPAGSGPWRRQAARAARVAARAAGAIGRRLGVPVRRTWRTYHPDELYWREPAIRARLEAAILRPASISADVFGRAAVSRLLTDFFERGAAPIQTVAALYVYESYHRDLPAHLAAAAAHASPAAVTL